MKKLVLATICSFTLLNSTADAAQLRLAEMPNGLNSGYFMMNGSYSFISMPHGSGSLKAEGPVNNYGTYGLAGSLDQLNQLLADPDTTNFKLNLRLRCKNKATETYQFTNDQLKAPGTIFISAPKNCN